jgi:aspartyl-tRNA(Asn)/glutamyl-tRNA(Gln) amidotransferase subunit A
MTSLTDLSLRAARDAIADGDLCPLEYLDALLARIDAHDASCRAFIAVDAERARASAWQRKRDWRKGELPPLFGIPFAVKDIIDVEGSVTTCQSDGGFTRPASRTASCIQRLIEAGGIYIGKTALGEFALGGTGKAWPLTRNPWNTSYTPGSSSSGSGSAVAARMVPLAIGTDTGGSIRSPVMMNGIVGLKPTFGLIPTDGVFPLAPSMDVVGPMARSVADVAMAFGCMAGGAHVGGADRAPRLGRIEHLWRSDLRPSPDMEQAIDRAYSDMVEAGATLEERRLPSMEMFSAVGWTTLFAEAFAIHWSRIADRPDLFDPSTLELLLTGAFVSAADFIAARDMRGGLAAALDHALQDVDALVTAVSALPPCRLDDADAMAALDKASTRVVCNVTGHPALALPVGLSSDGLPLGIQIIGAKFRERELLAVGEWIEGNLSAWNPTMAPPL